MEKIGDGEFSRAYLQNCVFKVEKRETSSVRRDYLVLSFLNKKGISLIPRAISLSEEGKKFVSFTSFIEGKNISLQEMKSLSFQKELVLFLKRLHSEEPNSDLQRALNDEEELFSLVKEGEKKNLINSEESLFFREELQLFKKEKKSLLHMDLTPSNIKSNGTGISGIIDFGDSSWGDPAREFVKLYSSFGRKNINSLVSSYIEKDKRYFIYRIEFYQMLEEIRNILWFNQNSNIDMETMKKDLSIKVEKSIELRKDRKENPRLRSGCLLSYHYQENKH